MTWILALLRKVLRFEELTVAAVTSEFHEVVRKLERVETATRVVSEGID